MTLEEALNVAQAYAKTIGETYAVVRTRGRVDDYFAYRKAFLRPQDQVVAEVWPPEPTTGAEVPMFHGKAFEAARTIPGFNPGCETCKRDAAMRAAGVIISGPSHEGSTACRMRRSIASGGEEAHCTCAACF